MGYTTHPEVYRQMDITIVMHLAAQNRSPSSNAHARLCLAVGGRAQTSLREALELFLIHPVGLVLLPVHDFGGAMHHDIIFQNPAGLPIPVAPLLRTRRGLKKEHPGRPRFFLYAGRTPSTNGLTGANGQ
jgi:hypothetical protein